MSQGFDWQTEDEAEWVEPPPPNSPPPPGRLKNRWPLALIALLVVGLLGFWTYDRLRQQIDEATAAAKVDVLATHNLVRRAAVQGDSELLHPLISGRDADWARTQDELVAENLFVDRAPWGLRLLSEVALPGLTEVSSEQTAVTFSADLMTAEVRYELPYQVENGSAPTETVTLQQTAVYRRATDRWLLSPPDEEPFWGEWDSYEGAHLSASFYERDREMVTRLAADLDAALDQMCRQLPELNCPADFSVTVDFNNNPDILMGRAFPARSPVSVDGNTPNFQMPSPTLLGVPVDEAGYQAIYRAYAAMLVADAITHLVGWECCRNAPFYLALLHYQLAQLDLRPWPVTTAVYERTLLQRISLQDLVSVWRSDDFTPLTSEQGWQIYLFVDFMLYNLPTMTAVDLQHQLSNEQSLSAWLTMLFVGWPEIDSGRFMLETLDKRLWLYAQTQILTNPEPPPIALPDQDIQLLCYGSGDSQGFAGVTLHRYDSVQAASTVEVSLPEFASISSSPAIDGVLLHRFLDTQNWQTSQWQNGSEQILFTADEPLISLGQTDPLGQSLLLYYLETERPVYRAGLLNCDVEDCSAEQLPGLPVWAPDALHSLIMKLDHPSRFPTPLWMGDRLWVPFGPDPFVSDLFRGNLTQQENSSSEAPADLVEIGPGSAPFWLDNETYGYIRWAVELGAGGWLPPTVANDAQEVVIATIHDDSPQLLFTLEELVTQAQVDQAQGSMFMRYVIANPAHSNQLFIGVHDAARTTIYILSYDRQTQEAAVRITLRQSESHTIGFSPDGRWLIVTGESEWPPGTGQLPRFTYLHDTETHETQSIYVQTESYFTNSYLYDWSADGRWLSVILGPNKLALLAPAHHYQQVIEHQAGNCMAQVWVNR